MRVLLTTQPAYGHVRPLLPIADALLARGYEVRFASAARFAPVIEDPLLREDPDFHQRIVMRIQPDRIDLRADASEDAGQTWRKDLDYIFERRLDPR